MGIFGSGQSGQARYSGELHNLQLTQSVFGTTVPIVFGTRRVAAKLLFYGGFTATKVSTGSGKGLGGGKNSSEYEYYADIQAALASGSSSAGCVGILNIWDQTGKLENEGKTFSYTIPSGGGSVTVASGTEAKVQQDLGCSVASAYSVVANDYGSGGSQTLSGTQQVALTRTTGTPASGEYVADEATSTYTFAAADAGKVVTISYSTVFSLYYREANQPAEIPTSSPYQVSTNNQAYYYANIDVVNIETGATLTYGTHYTVSGGVYTFSSSLAGVYVRISYTYTSSDSNITNSSVLNLTFFGGSLGQSVWSFMQSNFPSAAFGHTGICHVDFDPIALGTSATLPSYNYELLGLNIFSGGGYDAHPCDCLRTLLTDSFLGVGFPSANIGDWTSCYAYWASNSYFMSMVLDTQTSVASAMSSVIETGNVGAVWSDGLLKLVPYGDTTSVGNGYTYTPNTTPVATLTWNDLLPSSELSAGSTTTNEPLQVSQRAPQDCWNYVQAQFTNRSNDYNNEIINEQNDAFIQLYGRRIESSQTWDWISTTAAATWALNLRLKRQCYLRNGYKFWVSFRFARLEPMDNVVLPTGEVVRILQITDSSDGRRTVEAEQWTYGSADVTIYPKQTPTSFQPGISQALPGDTTAVIFEATPQSVLATANTLQIAVAGVNSNWGGCNIYVSTDGSTYSLLSKATSLNRAGLLSAALPLTADPDTSDTLSVDLTQSGGTLVTVTQDQADSFVSLCVIIDSAGTTELLSFETATLSAAYRYNLTYLRRGVYGTTIAAHAIGSSFAYIGSGGLNEYQYDSQYVGKTIYFKFCSFNLAGNQVQDIADVSPVSFTIPGSSLQNASLGEFSTSPANLLTTFVDAVSPTHCRIRCANFTAILNNQSVACVPLGSGQIYLLSPSTLYYVYYIDTAFAGGSIEVLATQDTADYVGKSGYYFLGSITTPALTATVYRPGSYTDSGTFATVNPTYAYDTNVNTCAVIGSKYSTSATGNCVYAFSSSVLSASATLSVDCFIYGLHSTDPTNNGLGAVYYSIDSGTTWVKMISGYAVSRNTYTATLASGTNLNTVRIKVTAAAGSAQTECDCAVYDINVQ